MLTTDRILLELNVFARTTNQPYIHMNPHQSNGFDLQFLYITIQKNKKQNIIAPLHSME